MRPRLATRRRQVRNVDDELAMGEYMAGQSRGGKPYVGRAVRGVTEMSLLRGCCARASTLVGGGWWLAERGDDSYIAFVKQSSRI